MFYPAKLWKFSAQNSKVLADNVLPKKTSPENIILDMQNALLKSMPQNLAPKLGKTSAQTPKKITRTLFFSKQFIFIKNFSYTRRIKFWQPCRKGSRQKAETFSPRNRKKIQILSKIGKSSSGHVECSFDNTFEIFPPI